MLTVLEKNRKLGDLFNELIVGKYDDLPMENIIITSEKYPKLFFLLSEVDISETIGNLSKMELKLGDDIDFERYNFTITVCRIIKDEEGKIEVISNNLIEWLFIGDAGTEIAPNSALNVLSDPTFNLLLNGADDFMESYLKLFEDRNFKEILEQDITEIKKDDH